MNILEARENASHHLPKRTWIYQALIMVDIISGAHKRLSATNWLDVQLLVTTNYKLINLDQISTLKECEKPTFCSKICLESPKFHEDGVDLHLRSWDCESRSFSPTVRIFYK